MTTDTKYKTKSISRVLVSAVSFWGWVSLKMSTLKNCFSVSQRS